MRPNGYLPYIAKSFIGIATIASGFLVEPQVSDGKLIFSDLAGECDAPGEMKIKGETVVRPIQQHLRLEDNRYSLHHSLMNWKNKLWSGERIYMVGAPQASGGNMKIRNEMDILAQHAGQLLKDGRNLFQERVELFVGGRRPVFEKTLLREDFMRNELADGTRGYAKPKNRYITSGQQYAYYKYLELVGYTTLFRSLAKQIGRRTCRPSRCARRQGRTCPSSAAPRCRPRQKGG